MSKIVVLKDLRPLFGEARNQGPRPTCLAFAASDAHAALRPGWVPLSSECAFYRAQQRANRSPSSGALLPSMLEALRYDGQPEEELWPYLPATPTDTASASWGPPAAGGPLYRRAGETIQASIPDIVQQLDSGTPVILLFMLSRAFYVPSAQGVILQGISEVPDTARRHAAIAVAHGTVDGKRAILVRNSWGTGWGVGGYGWISDSFLARCLLHVALLKEDIHVPTGSASA